MGRKYEGNVKEIQRKYKGNMQAFPRVHYDGFSESDVIWYAMRFILKRLIPSQGILSEPNISGFGRN